ncbi:MAG TPA: hypothetical protein V6C95_10235 [Coleofasciculaceae cyanobacterium]
MEEVQQQLPGTKERQLALRRLVDEMMRSRRICRPLKGQSLLGVLQEIYQEAGEQFLRTIDQNIDDYSPPEFVRNGTASLLNRTFKEVLDDDRLKRLALEAQQSPPQSQQRQYLLTELVNAIQVSNRLIHPQSNIPRDFYELIYDDAVNRTLLYVFQKIDSYDPERGEGRLMNWVNFRLQMTFRDLVHQYFKMTSLPLEPEEIKNTELETQPPLLSDMVTECIIEDQDSLFNKECIRNYPYANFQHIFRARRVDYKSWKEISEELNIPVTTLSSFYGRCIEKFAPIIKKYVQDNTIS